MRSLHALLLSPSLADRRLRTLRDARHSLAAHIGYPSYAHMVTRDRLAGHPDAVTAFLSTLSAAILPRAAREFAELTDLKQELRLRSRSGGCPSAGLVSATEAANIAQRMPRRTDADLEDNVSTIVTATAAADITTAVQPWDVTFLQHAIIRARYGDDLRSISSYFALSSVISGIEDIVRRVFRVQMVREPMLPGESWDVAAPEDGGRECTRLCRTYVSLYA